MPPKTKRHLFMAIFCLAVPLILLRGNWHPLEFVRNALWIAWLAFSIPTGILITRKLWPDTKIKDVQQ